MSSSTDKEIIKCKVITKNGPVVGCVVHQEDGNVYKFKGIPYAKPPVGNLRFRPPSSISPWTEDLDCTKDSPPQLGFDLNVNKIIGSEDCLYIEVSTPHLNPAAPLPVMFWMGCYKYFSYLDTIFDPTLLNNNGVIFVKCGFRLGPFGFLSIDDFSAPGNCGLKDIVMALEWVQRNIHSFGGDPTNVTIFGSSAGGAMVHLMMLSPMATGLFHKAIIQSASALHNFSLVKNPTNTVKELAQSLGINKDSNYELVEELRSIPASDIMNAVLELEYRNEKDEKDMFDGIFRPCVETEFEGQPAFLSKNPYMIIKSGNINKVPLIIGSNNVEGSILHFLNENYYDDYEKYNENVTLLVPRSLAVTDELAVKIGHQLLNFYLSGEGFLKEDTKNQYLQLISDYYFLYYVNKTVRLHSQYAPGCPIYYYILNHAGEWRVRDDFKFFNTLGHAAELPFIFRIMHNSNVCKGSRDSITIRKKVVKMWTNFAKYGNPTPADDDPLLQITWEPVENTDKLNYLSIAPELTKGRNPFHERMVFWEELHKEHMFPRMLVYFKDLGVSLC